MNTSTIELNKNEMEQAAGGGLGSYLTLLKQGCNHVLCHELGWHDFEWNGEWDEPFTMDGKRYRHRLCRCSRCGATKKSIGYFTQEEIDAMA